VLLRRVYRAPELFQLLATFALMLVIKDAALWMWGPKPARPRAPGLAGAVDILGRRFPTYDLFLIVVARSCLACVAACSRARAGAAGARATQDREWSARSA